MVVVHVKIATIGEGELGNWCSVLGKARDISLVHGVPTSSGVHPVSMVEFSQGIKPSDPEAEYSPPCGAEDKNAGNDTPLPHASLWRGA
jgi:hypothetical protein